MHYAVFIQWMYPYIALMSMSMWDLWAFGIADIITHAIFGDDW